MPYPFLDREAGADAKRVAGAVAVAVAIVADMPEAGGVAHIRRTQPPCGGFNPTASDGCGVFRSDAVLVQVLLCHIGVSNTLIAGVNPNIALFDIVGGTCRRVRTRAIPR